MIGLQTTRATRPTQPHSPGLRSPMCACVARSPGLDPRAMAWPGHLSALWCLVLYACANAASVWVRARASLPWSTLRQTLNPMTTAVRQHPRELWGRLDPRCALGVGHTTTTPDPHALLLTPLVVSGLDTKTFTHPSCARGSIQTTHNPPADTLARA